MFSEERTSSKWLIPLSDEGHADPASRTPEQELMDAEDPPAEVRSSEALGTWEVLEPFVHRLPPRDQDCLRFYYRDRLTQAVIGRLLGVSQSAVSVRMIKARKRLAWLQTAPVFTEAGLNRDLSALGRVDRRMLWLVYELTCQRQVAEILADEVGPDYPVRIIQTYVGRRVRRLVRKMAQLQAWEASSWRSKSEKLARGGQDSEARERAKEAHDARVARYTPYMDFYRSMWEDKRWCILADVKFAAFEVSAERKRAEFLSEVATEGEGEEPE